MNLTPIRPDDDTQFRASCADLAFLLFLRHVPHLPAIFLIPLARPPSDIQEEEEEENILLRDSATSSATDTTDSTQPPANFHAEPKPTTDAAVQPKPTVVGHHPHQPSADERRVDGAIHPNAPSKHHERIHHRTQDKPRH